MTDDEITPEEIVAGVLTDHFDHPYRMLHDFVAPDILNELKYHELIALVMEKDKEIAEMKEELARKEEEIYDLKVDNKHFRKELGFWKGYATGDDHDYEYESLA